MKSQIANRQSPVANREAGRGYELLARAAARLPLFSEAELLRVARAIEPDVQDWAMRVMVMEDVQWSNGLEGELCVRASSGLCWLAKMRRALVFFRAEHAAERGPLCAVEARLVGEVPRAEGGVVWLDVESGLPWLPRCVLQRRGRIAGEQRLALEAGDLEVYRKAYAVVTEIAREKRLAAQAAQAAEPATSTVQLSTEGVRS